MTDSLRVTSKCWGKHYLQKIPLAGRVTELPDTVVRVDNSLPVDEELDHSSLVVLDGLSEGCLTPPATTEDFSHSQTEAQI